MKTLSPGEFFAGCKIISLCGRGGFGIVYLALDAMNRKVALKIIRSTDSERELHGIREYIRVAENQKHLIRIYHAGIENENLYYIMEAADALEASKTIYVPKTLANRMSLEGKMEPGQVLNVIRELADGVKALHDMKLIHRDIKPENIIFVKGVVKLCDPGLVCSSEESASLAGTLGYLPPECFSGENLNSTGRDIYALGKVLYTAITGEPPAHCPRLPRSIGITVSRKIWPVLARTCGANAKHRITSTEEFIRSLPDTLPNPTFLDKKWEDIRLWQIANPLQWRCFMLFISLLLGGCVFLSVAYMKYQNNRRNYENQCSADAQKILDRFHRHENRLSVQLEEKAVKKILDSVRRNSAFPVEKLKACRELEQYLNGKAEKSLPPFPQNSDLMSALILSGKIRSLLDSPLGNYLPDTRKKQIEKELALFEKKEIHPQSRGLRPGSPFHPDSSFRMKFQYVYPGIFKTPKGKVDKVDYPYWVSDSELRVDSYISINPDKPVPDRTDYPMNFIVWNDLMDFCYFHTRTLQDTQRLPDNYIMRPLYGNEWSWACLGGWRGAEKMTSFLKQNSGNRLHAVRATEPNGLGIFDMIGNVSEMTIPERHGNNAVDIRGGNYLSAKADFASVQPYLLYQFLPPYVGARVGIAPGDMSFFEREFRKEEPRALRFNHIRYEVLVCNHALYNQSDSELLCDLLGGRLATVDSMELIKAFRNAFFELNSFPVSIAWRYRDGKWTRPDGKPFKIRMPKPPTAKTWIPGFCGNGISLQPRANNTGVICEWNDSDWQKRTSVKRIMKSKAVRHRFSIENRNFCLVEIKAHAGIARRIAALLGGRLAIPHNPELRQRFRKELAPWEKLSIMMDGRWIYDKWRFEDGSSTKENVPRKGNIFSHSKYLSTLGFRNGTFCELQTGEALLLEFPAFPDSASSIYGKERISERSILTQR